MSTSRRWAMRRRIQYGAGFLLTLFVLIGGMYGLFFYNPGTCFDERQNGEERGVDCGGACVRICSIDVVPPRIVWARSFEIVPGQYNAAAYVENTNAVAATPALRYTFELLSDGEVVTTRSGTTVLPPGSVYPIFEGRIFTDGKTITDTRLVLEPADMWLPATQGREQFQTSNISLSRIDTNPRLDARFTNTALTPARDVEVIATLFNINGEPITASQTFIPLLEGREERDIVFTWPQPIAKVVRNCAVPSDIMLVLDRSGSMAADGGDPPEPLESAKQSARTFVAGLQTTDQVGFLSYATTPSNPLEQTLTDNHTRAAAAISGTRMGTDGIQYTDMGAAIRLATSELLSERRREAARQVMIVFTDGDITRPLNPSGQRDIEFATSVALEAAREAKEKGVILYTIGLGSEVDEAILGQLASDSEKAFIAPTTNELDAIYSEITSDLCESGATQIDIIAKTATYFAPLR